MNILVTGGAGAIGALVVRELAELGHLPVIYSRNPSTRLMPDLANDVALAPGDMRDYDRLVQALKEHRVERIIHMASALLFDSEDSPPYAIEANVAGTARILQAARAVGIQRISVASSKRVWHDLRCRHGAPTFDPIREDHATSPYFMYGYTKVAIELLGKWYRQRHGLEFTALRFATTWGPGRGTQHRGYTSFVGDLITAALEHRPMDLEFDPDLIDDFNYNGNNAHALILGCLVHRKPSWLYNIGYGRADRLSDVIDLVKKVFPHTQVNDVPINPHDDPAVSTVVMDITRAQRELGYKPRFTLEESIRHCAEMTQNIQGRR